MPATSAPSLQRVAVLSALTIVSVWLFVVQAQLIVDFGQSLVAFPDFQVFWASGPTIRADGFTGLFDSHAFTARQNTMFAALLGRPYKVRPWLYPPTFLLFTSLFSLIPYLWSVAIVQIGGAMAMWWTLGRRWLVWLFVLLSPAVGATFMSGQLTTWLAAGFVGGVVLIGTRPVLAGVLLGLVSVKPHLFVLVPIALVAARAWRSLIAAMATAVALPLLSLAVFGTEVWALWLGTSTGPGQILAQHFDVYGTLMGSILSALRTSGVPAHIAWIAQVAGAGAASLVVWFVFARTTATAPRVLALSGATLLAVPYWVHYDVLLPTLAIAVAATDSRVDAVNGLRTEWGAESMVWILVWMLPYTMVLMRGLFGIPIGIPCILALLVVTLRRPELARDRLVAQL